MTTAPVDYLAARRTHLLSCIAALAKAGAVRAPDQHRFALVAWGAWTPGARPSTKLARLEYRTKAHSKDTRVWGRVMVGKGWAATDRSFDRSTVLATFWNAPSIPELQALRRALPTIPRDFYNPTGGARDAG